MQKIFRNCKSYNGDDSYFAKVLCIRQILCSCTSMFLCIFATYIYKTAVQLLLIILCVFTLQYATALSKTWNRKLRKLQSEVQEITEKSLPRAPASLALPSDNSRAANSYESTNSTGKIVQTTLSQEPSLNIVQTTRTISQEKLRPFLEEAWDFIHNEDDENIFLYQVCTYVWVVSM